MANKPLRPCRHPGCRTLVPGGYCEAHRPKYERGESTAWHGLYSLDIWTKQLRPNQLVREPFCRECWTQRRERVPATDVDHVVPHRGDMKLFTDPDNLQSLCHGCHAAKTMAERRGRTAGKPRG